MLKLTGVIPALTLPFRADESIHFDGYRRLIELVVGDGVHGIVVNGCTGESWAIDDGERAQVFRAAVEQVAGRVPVVAGAGAMTRREAIHKARQAAEAGCDAIMVQPPWYALPGEAEVMDYYKAVIAASALPVMVYNIPRRTGISLTVDMVDRLADEPKVIALKESSKDWLLLSAMIRRVRDRISVLAGYASLLGLAAITEGAVGYVDSTTPVVGRLSLDFYDACVKGDLATARRLEATLARLNFFGTGTFPATVKAALDMVGRPGGLPRDPIRPLDEPQKAKIRALLVEAGVIPPGASSRAAE